MLIQEELDQMVGDRGGGRAVSKFLTELCMRRRRGELLACGDQGRAFKLTTRDKSSNSFMSSGGGLPFSCYRFSIKGRLNLLPTKTVVKRMGGNVSDTSCPKCHNFPDTLGHTLNGCTPNTGLMRDRHNAVLRRLKGAVGRNQGVVLLYQKVRGSPGYLGLTYSV